ADCGRRAGRRPRSYGLAPRPSGRTTSRSAPAFAPAVTAPAAWHRACLPRTGPPGQPTPANLGTRPPRAVRQHQCRTPAAGSVLAYPSAARSRTAQRSPAARSPGTASHLELHGPGSDVLLGAAESLQRPVPRRSAPVEPGTEPGQHLHHVTQHITANLGVIEDH